MMTGTSHGHLTSSGCKHAASALHCSMCEWYALPSAGLLLQAAHADPAFEALVHMWEQAVAQVEALLP